MAQTAQQKAEAEAAAKAEEEAKAAAEAEAAAKEAPSEPTDEDEGLYLVTAAGASYKVGGDEANVALGLQGRVVSLVDSEAARLLSLDAIKPATDEDVERESARAARLAEADAALASGPASNPYGGSIVGGKSLEEHYAEQIALAKAKR